ncbi:ATP-dependent helicase [Vibrio parahaemolyticus]|nr:ATP-dependent helicase [Vibrio parahaemolyticus]
MNEVKMDNDLDKIIKKINRELNEQQYLAAVTTEGPVMIIASAGAGKTKTLIHRCATMLVKGISPKNIMVVTFTSKAAKEIKQRLEEMPEIGANAEYICAGTFHGIIFKEILTKFPESSYLKRVGINAEELTILDDADAASLLKQAISELPDLDKEFIKDNEWTWKDMQKEMSLARANALDLKDYIATNVIGSENEELARITATVWKKYNELCRDHNGVDFDDILLHADKMLQEDEYISKALAEQFKYLMLDEYQDTNRVQQNIMDSIAQHHNNICTVGDEKQSIYAFRGADISIILGFKKRYKDTVTIDINNNYRSYPSIINFANACATAMDQRLSSGIMINKRQVVEEPAVAAARKSNMSSIVEFYNETHEAESIAGAIKRDLIAGIEGKEIAVLYRNRNTKRELEKFLVTSDIPYEIIGDVSFYQKKHVKDAIALIRFIFHPYDSMAGMRLINASTLGVSLDAAKKSMAADGVNVHEFLKIKSQDKLTSKSAKSGARYKVYAQKIQPLLEISEELRNAVKYKDSPKFITDVLAKVWDAYLKPKDGKNKKKVESAELEAHIQDIKFIIDRIHKNLDQGFSMDDIIDDLIFMVDKNPELDRERDSKIKLMTLHASKGLEFDNVYMIGFDEESMIGKSEEPSYEDVEEARRLAYVGITRAKKKLTISYAKYRKTFDNSTIETNTSRFVKEIERGAGAKIHRIALKKSQDNAPSMS